MRIVRIGVALATIGTAAAVTPAHAHFALPRSAAGTTIIQADRSGTVDLTLRDDARVAVTGRNNPDVTFSGAGRVLAALLYRVDGSGDQILALRLPAAAGNRTFAFVTSSDPSAQSTCTGPIDGVAIDQTCTPGPSTVRLHEGVYRLAVLTDGSPVTVTLHLHGLRGERVFRPTTDQPSAVGDLNSLANPTGSLARGVAQLSPTARGVMFTVAVGKWAPKPNWFGSYGCMYAAGDPIGDQMLPNCPEGSGTGGSILDPLHQWPSGELTEASLTWAYGVGRGRYTLGQGMESDTGVTLIGGVSAWFATPGLGGAGGGGQS